jgi:glucose-1-phosphate thymidylyltransferase
MKGTILAGVSGSRLHPFTKGQNKHLIGVHDKPMIYYPLTLQILAGVRELTIVSNAMGMGSIRNLLGDGAPLGLHSSYREQSAPTGIVGALLEANHGDSAEGYCVTQGDNCFFGAESQLRPCKAHMSNSDYRTKPLNATREQS